MNSKQKNELKNITNVIFEDLKELPSYRLFQQYRSEEYPHILPFTVYEILVNNPSPYHHWLKNIYMKNLALDIGQLNLMMKQIRKLSYSQSKMIMKHLQWHLDNWEKFPEFKQ